MKRRLESSPWLAGAALLVCAACTGDLTSQGPPFSGGLPDGGRSASGSEEGAAFFQQNILPLMSSARPKGACSLCHQGEIPANGPDFLGVDAEANYSTLLRTPGLIGATAATSLLYTRGDHAGNAFPPAELALIEQWIAIEN